MLLLGVCHPDDEWPSAEKCHRDTHEWNSHDQTHGERNHDPSTATRKLGPAGNQLPGVRNMKQLQQPEPSARPSCAVQLLGNRDDGPTLSTHGSLNVAPKDIPFDTCRAHT